MRRAQRPIAIALGFAVAAPYVAFPYRPDCYRSQLCDTPRGPPQAALVVALSTGSSVVSDVVIVDPTNGRRYAVVPPVNQRLSISLE